MSWGIPTPATIRVVQMEPGPWPTLMAFAPAFARNSTPSALVTLPAMMVRSLKFFLMSCTASPTPLENPCAVEIAITSAPSLVRLWTWWRMCSLSRAPEGSLGVAMATPQTRRN